MRFRSDAQRKAVFANIAMPYSLGNNTSYGSGYHGRLGSIASAPLTTDDPLWLRFIPEKNKLSELVPDYPGKRLEDLTFNPLGEFGWYVPIHEKLMSDDDGDGIPLIYDFNAFGNFQMGADHPIGSTLTPNVEKLLASGRGIYDEAAAAA